jgi:acetyl esterase/lipase
VRTRPALVSLVLAVVLALALVGCGDDYDSESQASLRRDVPYVPNGGVDQQFDLFLPTGASGPSPLVVFVHGGRWTEGDKSDLSIEPDSGLPQLKENLLSHGYAVASINHRPSESAVFPAQVQDVKAAIAHLRANAADLKVDPGRFAVMGESSGGHLALLAGTTNGTTWGTTGDSSVQATVSYYGISDLRTRPAQRRLPGCSEDGGDGGLTSEGTLLGAEPNDPAVARLAADASPITHVDADDPPVLLLHGTQDCNVRTVQSQTMNHALLSAGVDSRIRLIEAPHADARFYETPALQEQLISFLDGALPPRR